MEMLCTYVFLSEYKGSSKKGGDSVEDKEAEKRWLASYLERQEEEERAQRLARQVGMTVHAHTT